MKGSDVLGSIARAVNNVDAAVDSVLGEYPPVDSKGMPLGHKWDIQPVYRDLRWRDGEEIATCKCCAQQLVIYRYPFTDPEIYGIEDLEGCH